MEITRLNSTDSKAIEEISEIHLSVLTESFLNNFGLEFLKIIYENLLHSKNSILIVSRENSKITGYLLAVTDYSKFVEVAVSKKKFDLAKAVMRTLLNKPQLIYKLATSLLKVSKEDPHAELQFIAILPECQGQGLGSKLMEELKMELEKIGIKQYHVGTKASNELSNRFYQKLGFPKAYTKNYFGDELNYYISN